MDMEQERLRLASDLAGLRFMLALVRLELKYRRDQPREAATGQGGHGGRFADEGRGTAHGARTRAPGFVAPAAAAARVAASRAAPVLASAGAAEAAAALAPAAGAVVAGGIGVSRAAGLAAVASGAAGGMTPILGLPLPHLLPQAFKNPGGGGSEAVPQGRFDEECEEQFEKDLLTCQTQAAMYGRGKQSKKVIYKICFGTAMERYAECRQSGVSSIRTPIYAGHTHFPPRKR